MVNTDKPIANPTVVFREDFDDWALLFDPDSTQSFGLNPVSAFIWKRLDGKHAIGDIVAELEQQCQGLPAEASTHVHEFIQELEKEGLVGYEANRI